MQREAGATQTASHCFPRKEMLPRQHHQKSEQSIQMVFQSMSAFITFIHFK